jgi:biotin carboxyl carrier protein
VIFALTDEDGIRQVEVTVDGSEYAISPENGNSLQVDAQAVGSGRWSLLVGDRSYEVRVQKDRSTFTVEMAGRTWSFHLSDPARALVRSRNRAGRGEGLVKAPMPGRILRIMVEPGQEVKSGEGIVVVEAMKMENELSAPRDGVVSQVHVSEGQTVESGAALVQIGD